MDLKLIGWSIFIIMYQCVFQSEAWHDQYDENSYDLTQQDILSSKRVFKNQLNHLRNLYGNNRQYVQHSATSKSNNDARKPKPHKQNRTENTSFSDKRSDNASVQDAFNNTVSGFGQNGPKDDQKARVPLSQAANEANKAKSDAAMKQLLDLLPGLLPNYLEQLKNSTNQEIVDELLTTTPSSYNSNEPDDYQKEYNPIKDEQEENNQVKDVIINLDADNSNDHLPTESVFQINKDSHPLHYPTRPTTECPQKTVYYPVPVYNMRPLPGYLYDNPPRSENLLPDTSQTSLNLNPMLLDSYANNLVCEYGSKWRRNCHECICKTDGSPICNKIENCQIKPPGIPMQCKPYSIYDLDECNKCECDGDGVPICTFLKCPSHGPPPPGNIPFDNVSKFEKDSDPPRLNHNSQTRFKLKVDQRYHGGCSTDDKLKRCAPGTRWQSECYECTCNWKGKQNCVRLPNCSLSPSGDPGRCKPNTTFFDKCMRCSCDDEGHPICDNLCSTNNYDDDYGN